MWIPRFRSKLTPPPSRFYCTRVHVISCMRIRKVNFPCAEFHETRKSATALCANLLRRFPSRSDSNSAKYVCVCVCVCVYIYIYIYIYIFTCTSKYSVTSSALNYTTFAARNDVSSTSRVPNFLEVAKKKKYRKLNLRP